MRIHKYRAWDKKNERMLQVVSMSSGVDARGGAGWFITGEYLTQAPASWQIKRQENPEGLYYKQYKLDPSNHALLQFTGLKAKGKEIYEGDICNHKNDPSIFEVIFRDGAFRKKYKTWDKSLQMPVLMKYDIELLGIKIIGNVWENKDLLEGE